MDAANVFSSEPTQDLGGLNQWPPKAVLIARQQLGVGTADGRPKPC